MPKLIKILKHFEIISLVLLVGLAFCLRLYRLSNPPLDWHAFRQADTASVSREYVKHGIDLLHPKYHDLSNIQSGQLNPSGYRMVEFPIVNALVAAIVLSTHFNLVIVSRLLAIVASLGTLLSLYFLVKEISGQRTAFWTALWFSLLPYAIFYSRVILPEPFMLFAATFSLLTFYFFLKYEQWRYWWLSLFSFALALLLKPFVIFLALVFLAFGFVFRAWRKKKFWLAYAGLTFAAVPLIAWREWIQQFPAGIPASDWLYNSDGIRLRPAWFRWLFYERLVKLFLGFIGVIFLPFSLLKLKKKEWLIYGAWWLGILAYFVVFATGNVRHDYYQNLMLPILVITLGRGTTMLENFLRQKFNPLLATVAVSFLLLVTNISAWQFVKGYFNINHHEYLTAGQAVDELLPKNAIVIAPDFGDTQFLYATNRRGFPIGFEISKKIKAGAQYYVTTSFDQEAKNLEKQYFTVKKTPTYLILNLTRPKSN